MNRKKAISITVFGPGAVGKALICALYEAGYSIASVVSRRPGSVSGLPNGIQPAVIRPEEIGRDNLGELLFLALPDDRIEEAARELAGAKNLWNGRQVVHCSGILTSEVLHTLSDKGAATASFHPIQTFADGADQNQWSGIRISVEGDQKTVEILEQMARAFGSIPLSVDRDQKRVLHLSAVFLSNYLVTLGSVADQLIRSSLPGEDHRLLHALLEQTAVNLASRPPEEVLTGPIHRGDVETVAGHLELLSSDPNYLSLYKLLGMETLRLASKSSGPEKAAADRLRELLSE